MVIRNKRKCENHMIVELFEFFSLCRVGGVMELIDIFRVKLYFFTVGEVNKTVAQNLA